MADIFISYAHADRTSVARLAAALERLGWSVWWDRQIEPGRQFDRVIERELAEARAVLAVWSARSTESDWVRAEAGEGLTRGILVPAMIEKVQPPLVFRQLHCADLTDWRGGHEHPGFAMLLEALAQRAGKPTRLERDEVGRRLSYHTLPRGTRVGAWLVREAIGSGGFGITYRARRVDEPSTQVALKEYFPRHLAVRDADGRTVRLIDRNDAELFEFGLDRFGREAETLARFRHRNIVRVLDFFQDNGTAYMAMPFERGRTLSYVLDDPDPLTEDEILAIVRPLLGGLGEIHRAGFLHRDIEPGNIFIRRRDLSPVFIDFGAARAAMGGRSAKLTTLVTPGYCPPEQYDMHGNQGPWTDLYGMGAVMYRAATGRVPPVSTRRLGALSLGRDDPFRPAAEACAGNPDHSERFLRAIDRALALPEGDRPQSVAEFREMLGL